MFAHSSCIQTQDVCLHTVLAYRHKMYVCTQFLHTDTRCMFTHSSCIQTQDVCLHLVLAYRHKMYVCTQFLHTDTRCMFAHSSCIQTQDAFLHMSMKNNQTFAVEMFCVKVLNQPVEHCIIQVFVLALMQPFVFLCFHSSCCV